MGQTTVGADAIPMAAICGDGEVAESNGADVGVGAASSVKGAYKGNVYGTYIHGFFDEDGIASDVVRALAAAKGVTLGGTPVDYRAFKESQYDKLADAVREYMDMKAVYEMLREARI